MRVLAAAAGEKGLKMEQHRNQVVADDIIDVLSHTLAEADDWHDQAHGGPICYDDVIDRARAILVANGRNPYPGVQSWTAVATSSPATKR